MPMVSVKCDWCGKTIGEAERERPAICTECLNARFPYLAYLAPTILEVERIEEIFVKGDIKSGAED